MAAGLRGPATVGPSEDHRAPAEETLGTMGFGRRGVRMLLEACWKCEGNRLRMNLEAVCSVGG